MSDEEKKDVSNEQKKDADFNATSFDDKLFCDGISVDWFLQSLVALSNKYDFELTITLTIGGSLVSGKLISGKKYFEKLAETVSEAMPAGNQEAVINFFAKPAETIYGKDNQQDPNNKSPQYIHLENAYIWAPGGGGALIMRRAYCGAAVLIQYPVSIWVSCYLVNKFR